MKGGSAMSKLTGSKRRPMEKGLNPELTRAQPNSGSNQTRAQRARTHAHPRPQASPASKQRGKGTTVQRERGEGTLLTATPITPATPAGSRGPPRGVAAEQGGWD